MFTWLFRILKPHNNEHEYRTVRYAFPLFVMSAILAGLAAVSSQDASYVSIVTEPHSVTEGEQFYIYVKVNAHVPINAVDLAIEYPESQVKIEGIDTGTSVITLWTEEPYARDGRVYLRGGVFQKGFLGEHTIARIKARATASGVAHVSTENATLIAGDGQGTEVAVSDTSSNETRLYITATDGTLEGKATFSIITDLDGDGSVSLADISAFMAAWFTRLKTFDFDRDGRMTFRDFSILLSDSFSK